MWYNYVVRKLNVGILIVALLALSSCETESSPLFSSTSFSNETHSLEVSSSSSSLDIEEPNRRKKPFRLYDKLANDYPSAFTFSLEEFGNHPFSLDNEGRVFWGDMDLINEAEAVFVYDVNNDGYRDFCVVASEDEETIATFVYVFDLHQSKETFRSQDSQFFYYDLFLTHDGLFLRQKDRSSNEETNEGRIDHNRSRGIYIDWQEPHELEGLGISVSSAGLDRTVLRNVGENGVYEVNVDSVSTYFLDVTIAGDFRHDDGFLPVSFDSSDDGFFIEKVAKYDSLQRYSFFFSEGSAGDAIVNVGLLNISKRIVFHVEGVSKYTKLEDVVKWPTRAEQIKSLEVGVNKNDGKSVICEMSLYSEQSDFSAFLDSFDCLAFPISEKDFELRTGRGSYPTLTTFYLQTTAGQHDFRAVSRFFQVGIKWYDVRKPITMRESDEKTLGFVKSLVDNVVFEPLREGYPYPQYFYNLTNLRFVLEGSLSKKEISERANYSFKVKEEVFYVLSDKEFASEDGSLYRITQGYLSAPVYG